MQISDKQKAILALLADGQFHSGTELADALNISRSAIWKQLNGLSELGIQHSAVSGKGYRLERPLELLDKSKILANLDAQARSSINSIEIFDQIPSTNSYLVERALDNTPSGAVCFAEQQTAGKGRRGRHWVSPFGSNIYMSILWRFQASPLAISGLSLAIGVAVIRALKCQYTNIFHLKWPNDIYYQGKKLGGILVEVSGESDGPCAAVIGLGLNIYLPESEAAEITQQWTDLTQITGQQQFNRNTLASTLLNELLRVITEFENVGITAYLDEWREYDCLKDKPATLFIGQHSYDGIVKGIDDNGLLLLTRPDGGTQAFGSGEVSFSTL
ncbi:bifunctional biotin--[acetyl-CoA-carboxylase] ligase/biotin operon repressor BirA [Methyloglobulus sp.]|uniref:bifunctional biotin--[acetyl-CoA-carboxylase] ligase/biotin operon repressor BirA n=1 Tax=Methyloglobulus sp. TaxID=2518622 RepID=UPI0018521314|nr:bifunctional biotin--[acetyl-CoA-carboxylase] ligase/biotin operon repressor BirA [Methyloglobulus sp.]